MACNQDQIKEKFPWTPERRAALMERAIGSYIKNGSNMTETVQGLSQELGLRPQVIMEGLRPEGVARNLTDQMWMQQYARRQIGLSAKRLATSMEEGKAGKAYKVYDSATRRLATVGHFTVFGKTHMGDKLWTNPVEYFRNFKNSIALIKQRGISEHEQRMTEMHIDDQFNLAVRSGLDVTDRSEASQILGGKGNKRAHAAFEELQLRRFENFKKAINSMPIEERTADNGKPIAHIINNSTGGGVPGRVGSFFGKFLFGPRLTPSQWRAAFGDNLKAVYNGILNRGNATPGELAASRMVASRMGRLLAVYGGALAAEYAYATATGDKRNLPNLANPADSGSFLRLKFFGKAVPLSPTVELIALPIKMFYSAYRSKPGDNAFVNFASPLVKYAGYRLSPGLSLLASLGVGQEIFSGRPLPWHQEQKTKSGQPAMSELTKPKLNYTEFLGERLPIPVAVFLRDVYDEMRGEGVDHPTAKALIQGAMAGATTGTTGYEWHPERDTPYTRAEAATPDNASEKQKQQILKKQMKDFKREKSGQAPPKELFGIGQ